MPSRTFPREENTHVDGQCDKCHDPVVRDHTTGHYPQYCPSCTVRIRRNEQQYARRMNAERHGRCNRCCRRLAAKGHKACTRCLTGAASHSAEKRTQAKMSLDDVARTNFDFIRDRNIRWYNRR